MGLLKKILIGISKTAFAFVLTLLIFTAGVVQLTSHTTGNEIFSKTLKITYETNESASAQAPQKMHSQLKEQCIGKTKIDFEFSEAQNITLKCTEISTIKADDLQGLLLTALFNKIYYKKYACSALNCLKNLKGPEKITYLFSESANKFFSRLMLYLLAAVVLLGTALVFLCESWVGRLKTFGSAFVSSGSVYFIMFIAKNYFYMGFAGQPEANALSGKIFEIFSQKFLIVFIIGAIILISGYVLNYICRVRGIK